MTVAGLMLAGVSGCRIELRRALPADDDLIFSVFSETCDLRLPASLISLQYSAFCRSRSAAFPSARMQIIRINGSDLGYCRTDTTTAGLHLIDLALLSEARGQGIGTFMVQQLLEEAGREGHPVLLTVARNNPAVRLYRRLGFEVTGSDELHFRMENTTLQSR